MVRSGSSGAQLMVSVRRGAVRQAWASTAKCQGASRASRLNTPLTGHRYLHHTRLLRPYSQPTAMAASVEPPSTAAAAQGY